MLTKTVSVSKNRQIAIPADFGVEPGEKLIIWLDPKGSIQLKKVTTAISNLRGICKDLNYSTKQFLKEKKEENKKQNKKLKLDKIN